jgi:hypothetical protein
MDNRDVKGAVWGVVLILAGMFLLFERFVGLPGWLGGYQWWGGLVVAVGLITIATASRAESVGSGVTLSLLGLWFVLVTNHVVGFTWYNSWPLALVAAGAGTVAHAIAANWLPDTRRLRRRRRDRWQPEDGTEESGHA